MGQYWSLANMESLPSGYYGKATINCGSWVLDKRKDETFKTEYHQKERGIQTDKNVASHMNWIEILSLQSLDIMLNWTSTPLYHIYRKKYRCKCREIVFSFQRLYQQFLQWGKGENHLIKEKTNHSKLNIIRKSEIF